MMPASQAIRRASAAEMTPPVSSWAALRPPDQGLQGHGDHDGGVEPAGLGEPLGRVALDQLDEGLAEPLGGRLGGRPAGPREARCLGAARAKSAFLSIAPVNAESVVNLPWSLPWPSSHTFNRAAAAASCSSRCSSLASWASAGSGSMTSSSRRPRIRRVLASWWAASPIRWASALATSSGSRSSGSSSRAQVMTSACSTCSRPSASAVRVSVVLLERSGEPGLAVGFAAGELGVVGQPVRGRGGAGVVAEVDLVGVGEDPGLELGDLGGQRLQRGEGAGGLVVVHRPQAGVGDGGDLIACASGRVDDG